ncbi:TetR/AcrR family transcriptional regulator [Reichenbachiella carrageenanivorans]|uniref:TetR/AcrR family transcriptional regulator n=1 Tax=Reichenbachiella carrageenanivorans TaxID=2979869 RepID=A0ABY6D1C4_9BACT|nr:TetR/AcrR family transcriptional regulator [Reichenbachiella carrageenanivorans]UXX79519.1 TetR/AcrR family transcriptional regulator [Reichenbachiella carrageenanivorans]
MINNTKDKILEVAESLFNRYGVRSVSMDDIARELSISKKTIYQSYKDKDELVFTFAQAHINRNRCEVTEAREKTNNAIEELVNLSACIREHVKTVNPSMIYDLQKYHPKSWSLWMDYKSEYIKGTMLATIARGKKEGFFREDLNAEILATFRVESIEMTFDGKVFPRDQFDFTEVQMTLFDHFARGMMTIKGQELYDSLIDAKSYESN